MKAYIDSAQSPSIVNPQLMRNLVKNASLNQMSRQKDANTSPNLIYSPHKPDMFRPNPAFHDITQEEYWEKRRKEQVFGGAEPVQVGGELNYTKEDALKKLNWKEYQLNDDFTKITEVVNPDKDKGITNDRDFAFAHMDMGWSDPDALRQNIEYTASRYAAIKERIETEFTGDEKTANLNRLEELMSASKDQIARRFADEVSGFFEENGVDGDRDAVYQSVLTALDEKAAEYEAFIASNGNYAGISGPEEDWLRKDSAYMASELRKAMAASDAPEAKTQGAPEADGYTLDEMEKMYTFTKELESYTQSVTGSTKAIITGNDSEESLGMKLAELNLKGKVFGEYAGVSDKVKEMVTKSIDNFITKSIEAEQADLDKWSSLQIQSIRNHQNQKGWRAMSSAEAENRIAEIKKLHTALDKNAVYAVIDRVEKAYDKTGDAGKALLEGAVYASGKFEEKARDSAYDGIGRYDHGDSYWRNFFVNRDKHAEPYDPLGFKWANGGYLQKESGLDCITNAWNSFMEKVTSGGEALIRASAFSAYA